MTTSLVAVMWRSLLILTLIAGALRAQTAAIPVLPEKEQAAQATKIIQDYDSPLPVVPPRKLRLVYFTPKDRDPLPGYQERLGAVMEDIRKFYRDGMEQNGFGSKTFDLERDAQGKIIFHVVKGKKPVAEYPHSDTGGESQDQAAGDQIIDESVPVLKAEGITFSNETVFFFCNMAYWDPKALTFRENAPANGNCNQTNGWAFCADSPLMDLANLGRKKPVINDAQYGWIPLGQNASIYIGTVAHEVGHAFSLQHCGERWDEATRGFSIMGSSTPYQGERRGGAGVFLAMASAMNLAACPLFTGSDKGISQTPTISRCDLSLSTNLTRPDLTGRKGALRVEGTVLGTPPIYGVIAYFDSASAESSIGGYGYTAPAATAVPDAQGRFAIEVCGLDPCACGELRFDFCHVNGAVSNTNLDFAVTQDGDMDLSQWKLRRDLALMAGAVENDDTNAARAELQKLADNGASGLAVSVALELVGTLLDEPKPSPAHAPATLTTLALGDAKARNSKVGWLDATANRIPEDVDLSTYSPLLDSGRPYATGLFAYPPSRWVFALGGRWKELSGEAGLHTFHSSGTVIFIIKADGREVFRSSAIHQMKKTGYTVNLAGVKRLELITEHDIRADPDDSTHGDCALWLDPVLSR